MIADFREPNMRLSNEANALEKKCEQMLGYSRRNIDILSFEELIEMTKKQEMYLIARWSSPYCHCDTPTWSVMVYHRCVVFFDLAYIQ